MCDARSPVNILVEGLTDVPVVQRLLSATGLKCGRVFGQRGKSYLLAKYPNYNQAARYYPWLTLCDLDNDADCAPQHLAESFQTAEQQMILRIAVREVEAWLLADRKNLSKFLGISECRLPANPDSLEDPKRELINAARHSRFRKIREGIVPVQGSGANVGRGYSSRITEFVSARHAAGWDIAVAAVQSDSLG